jgi:DNA-binding NtrC family response regulator
VASPSPKTGETTERSRNDVDSSVRRPDLAIAWFLDATPTGLSVLRGGRLTIGRSQDADLRLAHSSVSRQHAEIYRQGAIYAIRDLESTNGTWLDGERVEHAALGSGSVLRFGDYIGIVMHVDPVVTHLKFCNLAPGLWGGPTLMAALVKAKIAARSDLPLVIVGETGAGKERIARALHDWSGRSGPFIAINCSTVPAALAEAELFGHQRGAFTGAERARQGYFQVADGGSLFLDEIADLSLEVQAKLLRAVEMGEVVPLGGTATAPVNVRIIAATQERLEALVEQKRFRADLAVRLAGLIIDVPPLRERREEIPGLFLRFLEERTAGPAPRVAPELLEWLCLRDWAGNVRELELMARKLLALHATEPVLRADHAEELCQPETASRSNPVRDRKPLSTTGVAFRDRRESDLHRLKQALGHTEGNLKAAAESIGISRRRAYRLMQSVKPNGEAS